MVPVDLTPFGFTPTESLVYTVLLRDGPGTGYAVARAAGLARANTYAALEGLVAKGAARASDGKPKRFRPESPTTLVAQIVGRQARAVEDLDNALREAVAPESTTLVEVETTRGAIQLLAHEIARAREAVQLFLPTDLIPQLTPVLRKAAAGGVLLDLFSVGGQDLGFAEVRTAPMLEPWPGEPLLGVIDVKAALLAGREGDATRGYWGATPPFILAARHLIARATGSSHG